MSLSSFKDVWLKCTPHIKVSTARSDVCSLSEKHRNAIRETITDAENWTLLPISPKHIQGRRKTENWQIRSRNFMESSEDMGIQILAQSHSKKLIILLISLSKLIVLPYHSKQMGPLYFLVHLTWVRVDGLPTQYNYLDDESETIGIHGKLTRLISGKKSLLHRPPSIFLISYCMHVEDCCPPPTLRKNPPRV